MIRKVRQIMWSIEVSDHESEEEINQALLDEVDFDYIRECIARLKAVIEKYGPFTEVEERSEDSDPTAFTKTFHKRRGWICDELASVDPLKVWTVKWDPVNGYSYLTNGYQFEDTKQGIVEIKTWYIAEKNFKPVDDKLFTINTEFVIWQSIAEDEDADDEDTDECHYMLNIWEIIDSDDLSDQAIILELTSELYDY
jgi:hypothetical protein